MFTHTERPYLEFDDDDDGYGYFNGSSAEKLLFGRGFYLFFRPGMLLICTGRLLHLVRSDAQQVWQSMTWREDGSSGGWGVLYVHQGNDIMWLIGFHTKGLW